MSPELKNKLKQVLVGKTAVDMGQFRFLHLDRVREEAGDEWERLREKIYDVSAHFIEKRIGPDDAVIRCRGGFMIVFAALDPEAAEAHVRAIAAEMERFFLGEKSLAAVGLSAEARNVTTEELLEIVAQTQDESPSAPAEAAPVRERSPGWEAEPEKIARASGGKMMRERPTARREPWDEIIFRPVWDARRAAVVCNLATAHRSQNDISYFGRQVLMGRDDPELHLSLDLAVARAAQRGFQAVRAESGPTAIVMPVRYATLAVTSRRMEYIALLRSVPEALRRFFYLRVDGVPDGAPIGGMQEVFRSMRPLVAETLVKLDLRKADMKRFEGCGVGVFDANIPRRLEASADRDALLAALQDRAASAAAMKAETALSGLANPVTLEIAMAAGVRHFSGPLVGPATPLPAPPRPLSAMQIADDDAAGETISV